MNAVANFITKTFPTDVDSFKKLLDECRPRYHKVEGSIRRNGKNASALIMGDGQIIHVIEMDYFAAGEIEQKVGELVEYYRHPPVLWPGCRGDLATKVGGQVGSQSFNRWFDQMVNEMKGR